jgi:hypothetical protein
MQIAALSKPYRFTPFMVSACSVVHSSGTSSSAVTYLLKRIGFKIAALHVFWHPNKPQLLQVFPVLFSWLSWASTHALGDESVCDVRSDHRLLKKLATAVPVTEPVTMFLVDWLEARLLRAAIFCGRRDRRFENAIASSSFLTFGSGYLT